MKFKSSSHKLTRALAALLGRNLIQIKIKTEREKQALVLGLSGSLGAGKTVFINGFARGVGIKRRLTSPTFVIMRNYPINSKFYKRLFHIDVYRIKNPAEMKILGLKDIMSNPRNIVLVEWAEKIKSVLPRKPIWVVLKHGPKPNERFMILKNL